MATLTDISIDVTFIITCYNYEDFVEEAINSCLNQKHSKISFEVIFIDDGSSDNSWNIISSKFSKKVRCYALGNVGIEKASNFAVSKSRGRYVVRVDADNLLCETYLRNLEQSVYHRKDIIYTDYYVIDTNGMVVDKVALPKFDKKEIISRGDFLATGTMYNKESFLSIGGFDCTLKNSGLENFALILNAMEANYSFCQIRVPCFKYRIHNKSLSSIKRREIMQTGEEIFSGHKLTNYSFGKFHPWAGRR